MIPITSIINFLSSIVILFLFVRLAKVYGKTKNKNVRYFTLFYLYSFIFLVLIAIPGLLNMDPYWASYLTISSYLVFHVGMAYLSQIPLFPFGKKGKKFIGVLILFFGLMIFLLDVAFIEPMQKVTIGDTFFILLAQEPPWLRAFGGAEAALFLITIAAAFLKESEKLRQAGDASPNIAIREAQYKSSLIGTGLLTIALAATMSFIIFSIKPTPWAFIAGSTLSLIGWITIFRALYPGKGKGTV